MLAWISNPLGLRSEMARLITVEAEVEDELGLRHRTRQ